MVLFSGLEPVDTEFQSPTVDLTSTRDVELVETSQGRFLYVAARADNQITVFTVAADGTLAHAPSLDITAGTTSLTSPTQITSATVADKRFLLVTSDGRLTVYEIADDGSTTERSSLADTATLYLENARYGLDAINFNGTTFVAAAGDLDNGLSVFKLQSNGTLINTANVGQNTPNSGILSADEARFFVAGSSLFILFTDYSDSAVRIFSVNPNTGTVAQTDKLTDSDNAAFKLDGATPAAIVTSGNQVFVAVGGYLDSGIEVFFVGSQGTLFTASRFHDPALLDGISGLKEFTFLGETFIAATSVVSNTLSVFKIDPTGQIELVTSITDTGTIALGGATYSAVFEIDGRQFIAATGSNDDGVSVFELGGGNDLLPGTSDADTGYGLTGNDTLALLDGNDVGDGGTGNDLLAGGRGEDTLSGGDGDDIITGDANADSLLGGDDNDLLIGGGGADILKGQDGEDTLHGNAGVDTLRGGNHNDRLAGHGASDTLRGDAGDDLLFGGDGKDYLNGDAGNDTLFGGTGSDFLEGGTGNDRLVAGTGFDRYKTGTGNDVIVFKPGDQKDKIADFEDGVDRVDLTHFNFADFNAVLAATNQSGSRLRIDGGGGDVLLVENFNIANFDALDVII